MQIIDVIQNTPQWHDVRRCRVTASEFHALLVAGKNKRGLGTGALTMVGQLVDSIIRDEPAQRWNGNEETDFGHTHEDDAADLYAEREFKALEKVGFVIPDRTDPFARAIGCSPDRLYKQGGQWVHGVEIKCLAKQHYEVFRTGKPFISHVQQCQFSLRVTGLNYWDLVYYNPEYSKRYKAIKFRILPDPEIFKTIDKKVEAFRAEAAEQLQQCRKITNTPTPWSWPAA